MLIADPVTKLKEQIEFICSESQRGIVSSQTILVALQKMGHILKDQHVYIYCPYAIPAREFAGSVRVHEYNRISLDNVLHISRRACVVILDSLIRTENEKKHYVYLQALLATRTDLDIWHIYDWR